MKRNLLRWSAAFVLTLAMVIWAAMPAAAVHGATRGKFNPKDKSVEMFEALEQGQIEVKLIPRDAKQSTILITNKTDQPLNVELPEAFVGVPVLAQFGGGGLGGGGLVLQR